MTDLSPAQGLPPAAGAAALLTGGPIGPAVAGRRWPWALAAAVAGAAAGAAVALALRRRTATPTDGEPQPPEPQAVVDLRDSGQTAP